MLVAVTLLVAALVAGFVLLSPSGRLTLLPAATLVAVPDDHLQVSGLEVHQESTAGGDQRVSISYVTVPGIDALTPLVQGAVNQFAADYRANHQEGTPGELNLAWQVPTAAGQALAIRQTGYYTLGAQTDTEVPPTRSMRATFHVDTADRSAWTSPQLFTAQGGERAVELINTALRQARVGQLVDGVGLDQALGDLTFSRDGSAILVLTSDLVTATRERPWAVRISPHQTVELLSAEGQRIRAEVLSGAPFAGLPEQEQPTATPSVTPSASPSSPTPSLSASPSAPASTASSSPVLPEDQVDCAVVRCIALTFDDGPSSYTHTLLDTLASRQVKATFFVVGSSAQAHPELIRRMVQEGHVVGNHTFSHPDLTKQSAARIGREIDQTSDVIEQATGQRPTLIRPPYGAMNKRVKDAIAERQMAAILWNVDTEDWKNRNVEITTQRALAGARPGAIILFHDVQPTTVQAIPGVISELRARGYTLVTVPTLLAGQLTPGTSHFGRV